MSLVLWEPSVRTTICMILRFSNSCRLYSSCWILCSKAPDYLQGKYRYLSFTDCSLRRCFLGDWNAVTEQLKCLGYGSRVQFNTSSGFVPKTPSYLPIYKWAPGILSGEWKAAGWDASSVAPLAPVGCRNRRALTMLAQWAKLGWSFHLEVYPELPVCTYFRKLKKNHN